MNTSSHSRQLLLLAIVLIALALRLWHLGDQSLWIDEANSFSQARGSLPEVLELSRRPEVFLDFPLERVILSFCTEFPPDAFLFRLPAALWGVLGVALTYALTRRIWGERAALLTAGLVAFSPYHIRYSQEARNYTSFAALHLLTLITLADALRRQDAPSWRAYALAVGVSFYDHLYAFFALAWQVALHLIWRIGQVMGTRRRQGRPLTPADLSLLRAHIVAVLAGGGLFLPWVLYLLAGVGFDLSSLASTAGSQAPGTIHFDLDLMWRFWYWLTANGDSTSWWPAISLICVGTALAARPARRRAWAVLGYCAVLFATVAVLSRLSNTYLAYRRLLFLLPLLFGLIAKGMELLWDWAVRFLHRWRWVGEKGDPVLFPAAALLLIGVLSWPAIGAHYRDQKENWEGLAPILREEAGADAWIVNLADSYNAWQALRIYLGDDFVQTRVMSAEEAVGRPDAPPALWLVMPIVRTPPAAEVYVLNDPSSLRVLDGDRSLPPLVLMLALERWDLSGTTPQEAQAVLRSAMEDVALTAHPIPLDWRAGVLNALAGYYDEAGLWTEAGRVYSALAVHPAVPADVRANWADMAAFIGQAVHPANGDIVGTYGSMPALRDSLEGLLRERGVIASGEALGEEGLRAVTEQVMRRLETHPALGEDAWEWEFRSPAELEGWEVPTAGAEVGWVSECGVEPGCVAISTEGAGFHGAFERSLELEAGRIYLVECRLETHADHALQGKALFLSYRRGWRNESGYASAFWGSGGPWRFSALLALPAGVEEITFAPLLVDHAGQLWLDGAAITPLPEHIFDGIRLQ